MRQLGEPVVGVDADRGDLGHAGDHPHEPVGPAGGEAGEGADVFLGVGGEGAGHRAVQQELAEGAHDEEDHGAADRVGEDEAGAGLGDRPAGAEEQADADGAAERDQLDVPILEAAMQVARLPLLFGVSDAWSMCFMKFLQFLRYGGPPAGSPGWGGRPAPGRPGVSGARQAGDDLDLDGGAARQRRDLHRRARRLVAAEAPLVDRVQPREVAEVGHEDGRLHDVAEPRAGLGQHGGEVVEDLFRLRLDPSAMSPARVSGSWPEV